MAAQQTTFDFLDTSDTSVSVGKMGKMDPLKVELSAKAKKKPGPRDPAHEDAAKEDAAKEDAAKEDAGPVDPHSKETVLRQLRARVGCIQTASRGEGEQGDVLSTGSEAIDRLLPRGGLRPDAITEWVAQADGCGAGTLAMITAAIRLDSFRRGPLVVVSGDGFYPPAAIALGISAERIIWVRPTRQADLVWAIDQALRCESVAAVWAEVGANLDDRDARRFQLAAETGCTAGLLIRPAATRGRPTFADVRLHVDNAFTVETSDQAVASGKGRGDVDHCRPTIKDRVMKVTLDRCRGGMVGHSVWVQVDDQARLFTFPPQRLGIAEDESAALRLASELAHPKTATRKAGRRRA